MKRICHEHSKTIPLLKIDSDCIRVILAGGHTLTRSCLEQALGIYHGIKIIETYETIDLVANYSAKEQVDLLILDIWILQQVETIAQLIQLFPISNIILLPGLEEETLLRRLFSLDIQAILLHDEPLESLISAIHKVQEGGVWYSLRLIQLLSNPVKTSVSVTLSEREHEILVMISNGKTYDCIARTLMISPRTVRYHLEKALIKLDAQNRVDAICKAKDLNLI
jgi:DNA-binding NarL/FixJ family response regulator